MNDSLILRGPNRIYMDEYQSKENAGPIKLKLIEVNTDYELCNC